MWDQRSREWGERPGGGRFSLQVPLWAWDPGCALPAPPPEESFCSHLLALPYPAFLTPRPLLGWVGQWLGLGVE